MLTPPLLAVRNLTIAVRLNGQDHDAVDDISFSLPAGHTLGIVGESGSGKSLTARALMALLPRGARVTSGAIRFEGTDLCGLPDRALRRLRGAALSMIFQDPLRALDPTMAVGDQIAEAVRAHRRVGRGEMQREVLRLLDAVRIPAAEKRMTDYPHQLSGGMRQRVMIAIALAGRPKLLIADEPTTALDVTTQAEILDLLKQLQQALNMAMILITHDMGVAAECADRIAVMYAGRIVEEGDTARVFASPRMPYTSGLLQSVVDFDTVPRSLLHTIGGRAPHLMELPDGCRFHTRCAAATERCRMEVPQLDAVGTQHRWACWSPLPPAGEHAAPPLRPGRHASAQAGRS
jgi:oligopeptide/dipeptide ABC transporter ATP-binding protein